MQVPKADLISAKDVQIQPLPTGWQSHSPQFPSGPVSVLVAPCYVQTV
jgi:hypothetical protein